jgi:hypothetical protein
MTTLAMAKAARREVRTGRLRAADPFELIRWLARSQTDPRKALAELVQNSLDASARTVTVTRLRQRAVTTLRVLDDGEGVIPDLARPEALAHIATHIGHSRKRNLTPEQRRELLLQGQYGIGLLGFWSIGAELEVRSQLGGGEPWVLRMWEEKPNFEVAPLRGRLGLAGTWTEVIVRRLHRPALAALTGRRIGDYLAAELRGQLLERGVTVTIHDRMARGLAQKVRRVEPVRFCGERLPLAPLVLVGGHGPIRVELYLVPEGGTPGQVSIACGGTVVYDDLGQVLHGRFDRAPWNAGRLVGLLDFPDFAVAPGSRRGVLADDAAETFARVVETEIEPAVCQALTDDARRRSVALEADLVQKLERTFRDLSREAPEYDFLAVAVRDERDRDGPSAGPAAGDGMAIAPGPLPADDDDEPSPGSVARLFPTGPLAQVEIVPKRARVERWGERRLRAHCTDADGARVGGVECAWSVVDGSGAIAATGAAEAVFRGGADTGRTRIAVTARKDEHEAFADGAVEVVDEIVGAGQRTGIPEPTFVPDPHGEWRSRIIGARWEVNSAHRDFLSVESLARRKLRYLAALLAKEIVVHSFPLPQGGALLERLVAVLTLTERRLERG